jgi:hypothetical protein
VTAPVRSRWAGGLAGLLLTAAVLAGLLLVSDAPFRNPAPAEAEFVFSFRANGDWLSGAAVALPDPAHDTRPKHMRTALPAQRTRAPVTVRLTVDGRVQEHVFRPKGVKADGTSVGELRVPLSPGPHAISVSLATSADPAAVAQTWSGNIGAQPRHLTVLSYAPGPGFQVEQ